MSGWQIAENETPSARRSERFYVSLTKRSEIVINPAAWSWLGDIYNVALLYDAEKQLLGVKFPVAGDRGYFSVRRCGRGRRHRIIYARRMVEQFGITIKETMVFRNPEMTHFNRERMLVLDLKTAQAIPKTRPTRVGRDR